MILVREVFSINPQRMREAKELAKSMRNIERRAGFPPSKIMTDLTGEFWTLVFHTEFVNMGEFESMLKKVFATREWQRLYPRFRKLVEGGRREIYTLMED